MKKSFSNIMLPDDYFLLIDIIELIYKRFEHVQEYQEYLDKVLYTTKHFFDNDYQNDEDMFFSIGVSYPHGGCDYIGFEYDTTGITIVRGGSEYDENIGSDSWSERVLYIQDDGYTERRYDLSILENELCGILNTGGSISIE